VDRVELGGRISRNLISDRIGGVFMTVVYSSQHLCWKYSRENSKCNTGIEDPIDANLRDRQRNSQADQQASVLLDVGAVTTAGATGLAAPTQEYQYQESARSVGISLKFKYSSCSDMCGNMIADHRQLFHPLLLIIRIQRAMYRMQTRMFEDWLVLRIQWVMLQLSNVLSFCHDTFLGPVLAPPL
jgi:hypothetical protein